MLSRIVHRMPCTVNHIAINASRKFSSAAAATAPAASSSSSKPKHTYNHDTASPVYTPSIFEKLFNNSKSPRIPLDQPFPGINLPSTISQPMELSQQPEISTLDNGLRVVTLQSASPIASIGVFTDAGSRYETVDNQGIHHFLEQVTLKSTKNRSDFRLTRDMLKLGANVYCASHREHMFHGADCLNEHVPHVLGTLGDVIQYHSFEEQELIEERDTYLKANEERSKIQDLILMETVHEAAYGAQGLGLSQYAPNHNLERFNTESLHALTQSAFLPSRMIISAVGVDHAELVKLSKQVFTALPASAANSSPRVPTSYKGGELRMHSRGDGGLSGFAMAFDGPNWHSPDLIAATVLQTMMGGGGAFTAGGPGKGMYTRLYKNILNNHDWAETVSCFNSIFSDNGLFGIYAAGLPSKTGELVDSVTKEMIKMTGSLEDIELTRAKNQLKSSIFMQLESRPLKLEDMGRQIMVYGKMYSAMELANKIDAISAADINRVATNMLKSTLTLTASGDLTLLPRYEQIQRAFK